MKHFTEALFEDYLLIEEIIDKKYLNIIDVVAGPNAVIKATYGKNRDVEAAASILRKDTQAFKAMLSRFNSFSRDGITMKATDMTDSNKDMLDEGEYLAYIEVFLDQHKN